MLESVTHIVVFYGFQLFILWAVYMGLKSLIKTLWSKVSG